MKIKVFIIGILVLTLNTSAAELTSLSQLFRPGYGILDQDADGYPDKISFCIVVPDFPSAYELAAASDIAARVNFESLVIDFSLVKRESNLTDLPPSVHPIFIGSNLEKINTWAGKKNATIPALEKDQGLVSVYTKGQQSGVYVVAGSGKALLSTVRALFLRWPYMWDIWGREEGATFFLLEKDITDFFQKDNIRPSEITITSALYEFPTIQSPHESIKKLRFSHGEIKNLMISLNMGSREQKSKAFLSLKNLRHQHQRGTQTSTLNYPGCSQITFELHAEGEKNSLVIPRLGYPKRMLTPPYKSPTRPRKTGKKFDLQNLFTIQGFYSDSNGNHIPDSLDTTLVLPQKSACWGTQWMSSRLVLHTAGSSFPLVYLDEEIENKEALQSPIVMGRENLLYQELVKTGKLKTPPLQDGWGSVQVIPQAFNKSPALVITGKDDLGMESTLRYFSQTFPFLKQYGEGNPALNDLSSTLEEFFEGKHGSAEAFFWLKLKEFVQEVKDKEFDHFRTHLFLPSRNKGFVDFIHHYLKEQLFSGKTEVHTSALRDPKEIFQKEKEFSWEGDDAFSLIEEKINSLQPSDSRINISIGVSESPPVRSAIAEKISRLLEKKNFSRSTVEVLSSYKQGFFWIREKVLPVLKNKPVHHLLITFAKEHNNFSQPRRFYAEPFRWLQELYPVDDIISKELGIPLEKIVFESNKNTEPVYEVFAYDEADDLLFKGHFTPRTREAVYLQVLPEWGTVKLTTGWVNIKRDNQVLLNSSLKSDLEKFWEYYQGEVLPGVYSYILKKTGNEPSFNKQPYFKRLLIEMWFSEPDYKLGLDEEMVSSLEAIHDEIYFDTLDFLRGITRVQLEDEDALEDTSRFSAPGNILPMIHPSSEGKGAKVKVTFEDTQARLPKMVLDWKEKGRTERSKTIPFTSIKTQTIRTPSFIYNGSEQRIEKLMYEVHIEKEKPYLALIHIIESLTHLQGQRILSPSFCYPNLKTLGLRIKHKEWEKEEFFTVLPPSPPKKTSTTPPSKTNVSIPTKKIISPKACLELVEQLDRFAAIRTFIAGTSYQNRKIPVLEIFTPLAQYVSLPRLITFKPTLYLSGRQHANEVSSTNYILQFAKLLAADKTFQKYIQKMNIVLHPMENPDGAELAYHLQKLTPLHSLHAGRYSALGIDVGYQVNAANPLLPEAKVRKNLYDRWVPDIYLNLHGYPSHEWVQPFSNYTPYLFRDYWIPRGWFAYYRSVSLPIYKNWTQAGTELKEFIIKEFNAHKDIHASNQKFYDRYFRWAARWQPHMNYLEKYQGVNLYAKRRSSRERRLTARRRTTFVEETPELMDETAHGEWLHFLCTQGLTYLKAHANYLFQTEYDIARIEEERQNRVRIQFIRDRPGKVSLNIK